MDRLIDAETLRAWLSDGAEIALLDVREPGQFDAGHLFYSVPIPYSRLEIDIGRLVPNPAVRVVLCDEGDGVAALAARRLAGLGYAEVSVLQGSPERWRARGFGLFEGVNTISKAFGELVKHEYRTPHLSAVELKARIDSGDKLVILDGRPFTEYRKMNIPGSICCPNGELALRAGALAPDPDTTIVVNCAGRTRSIIGAQSLRCLGIGNPVLALENGTQGWFLAGYELEHGGSRCCGESVPDGNGLEGLRARTLALIRRYGVPRIDATTLLDWRADPHRTTYVLDVRTAAEFAADARPGTTHAPGGQLLQAMDLWIGVRGARIVLSDIDGVRAGVIAMWLRQMGREAVVLEQGGERSLAPVNAPSASLPEVPGVDFQAVGGAPLIDLRSSAAYRRGHAAGAVWSVRPRVAAAAKGARQVALIADDRESARLAAVDLIEIGIEVVGIVDDAPCTENSPGVPSDAEALDFMAFAHGRHDGDREAALRYLSWEIGLVDRLTADERATFAVARPD